MAKLVDSSEANRQPWDWRACVWHSACWAMRSGRGVFKDSHTGQRPQEAKQPAVTFRKPGLDEQQLRVAGGLRGNRGLNKRRRGSEGLNELCMWGSQQAPYTLSIKKTSFIPPPGLEMRPWGGGGLLPRWMCGAALGQRMKIYRCEMSFTPSPPIEARWKRSEARLPPSYHLQSQYQPAAFAKRGVPKLFHATASPNRISFWPGTPLPKPTDDATKYIKKH